MLNSFLWLRLVKSLGNKLAKSTVTWNLALPIGLHDWKRTFPFVGGLDWESHHPFSGWLWQQSLAYLSLRLHIGETNMAENTSNCFYDLAFSGALCGSTVRSKVVVSLLPLYQKGHMDTDIQSETPSLLVHAKSPLESWGSELALESCS